MSLDMRVAGVAVALSLGLEACGPIFSEEPTQPEFVTVPCPQNLVSLTLPARPEEPAFGEGGEFVDLVKAHEELNLYTDGLEREKYQREVRHRDCLHRIEAQKN